MGKETCGGVGVCRLPRGHRGLCLFAAFPPGQPPITLPAGDAQIGENAHGDVVVDFGSTGPWQWVAFSPEQARRFGEIMIGRADRLLRLAATARATH